MIPTNPDVPAPDPHDLLARPVPTAAAPHEPCQEEDDRNDRDLLLLRALLDEPLFG